MAGKASRVSRSKVLIASDSAKPSTSFERRSGPQGPRAYSKTPKSDSMAGPGGWALSCEARKTPDSKDGPWKLTLKNA